MTDAVFAAAAAAANRKREYESLCEQLRQEIASLAQPLDDTARFAVQEPITDEDFALAWASKLLLAGQAVTKAGFLDLLEDAPEAWMPARLARAALRAAEGGPTRTEEIARRIILDEAHRMGVRPALQEIADELNRRLWKRHEDTVQSEFPDLATTQPPTPTQPFAVPSVPPAGPEKSEGDKPKRLGNRPSKDRQNDIIAAIIAETAPLQRDELVRAMRLPTEGKLGHQLAWLVENKILTNIPQRGYWPAHLPIPE